ncbi:MAG: ComEC/Rec2 family competence protein [bacterium]
MPAYCLTLVCVFCASLLTQRNRKGRISSGKKVVRLLFISVTILILGMVRVLIALPKVNENHVAHYNGSWVEFIGIIASEPDARIAYTNYTIKKLHPTSATISELSMPSIVKGKILIKTGIYPTFNLGDELTVACELQKPKNTSAKFKYDKYLQMQGIHSICYYPRISLFRSADDVGIGNLKLSSIYRAIVRLKVKVADRVNLLWPEPKSGFMAGLLYGSRSGLPEDVIEYFNASGITHIIAISGYNISIIVVVIMNCLIHIGFNRRSAFWLVLAVIFAFVIFTGASASVMRAAIMGCIVLLAGQLGRASKVFNLLVMVLVVMVLINPLSIFYDCGFQLSFLATIGLVYLSPLVKPILKWETVASTFSAIIATMPLMLYQFERFSIVAIAANILILWIIPILMLGGFIATAISFVFFLLGLAVAHITGVGMDYVLAVAKYLGSKPFSSVELSISLPVMLLLYAIMLVAYFKRKK